MLPAIPGDIGDAVDRTILAHGNRVDEPGASAVAEENRAVIGVLRGPNIVGYQVQIFYRFALCTRRCSRWSFVQDHRLSIFYDATFRQVIQGMVVRPKGEAEIPEMEIILHAASHGRLRRNAPQHINVLRPRIESE